jgi:hypothetical protein
LIGMVRMVLNPDGLSLKGKQMFNKTFLVASALSILPASALADIARLEKLLAATPAGGWVQANTTSYSSAWASGLSAVPPTPSGPEAVVTAWSSFAWDSTRGDLLLWGGGHANYAGNEMYVWDGGTGVWARGSLSSSIDANNFVVDNAAPQSSHTYDNNVYLPVNDRFVTFGGAAFNSGGVFTSANGREGPWLWDPSKADANKVGGTDGSGYDKTSPGGNMWTNRHSVLNGSEPGSYLLGTTAYRTENGKDVVYLTGDQNSSGRPPLYRYTFGDVKNGEADKLEMVGVMGVSVGYTGAATIDSNHNLYIRSARGGVYGDFAVWDLSKSNAANPNSNPEIKVDLKLADGSLFEMNENYGVEYDAANGKIYLWDGAAMGKVWSVDVGVDAGGNVLDTWVVNELFSTTTAQPSGGFPNYNGVLGKWKYVSELDAFIAMDQYDNLTGDAGIWLYKPFARALAAIPEPGTYTMLLAGLGLLAIGRVGRRQRIG